MPDDLAEPVFCFGTRPPQEFQVIRQYGCNSLATKHRGFEPATHRDEVDPYQRSILYMTALPNPTPEEVKEFQRLWLLHEGKALTDEEAEAQATYVLQLFCLLGYRKPQPQEDE